MARRVCGTFLIAVLASAALVRATPAIDQALQAKVDEQVSYVQSWANAPMIVAAVKAVNAGAPAAHQAMTQEKWAALVPFDPVVLGYANNAVGKFLKAKRNQAMAETFVSAADGTKVGFRGKPSNWSHKGKPKHDVPMTGRVWQGEVEVDESSGLELIQVAVPVLDGGKPIGSVIVGLQVARLK